MKNFTTYRRRELFRLVRKQGVSPLVRDTLQSAFRRLAAHAVPLPFLVNLVDESAFAHKLAEAAHAPEYANGYLFNGDAAVLTILEDKSSPRPTPVDMARIADGLIYSHAQSVGYGQALQGAIQSRQAAPGFGGMANTIAMAQVLDECFSCLGGHDILQNGRLPPLCRHISQYLADPGYFLSGEGKMAVLNTGRLEKLIASLRAISAADLDPAIGYDPVTTLQCLSTGAGDYNEMLSNTQHDSFAFYRRLAGLPGSIMDIELSLLYLAHHTGITYRITEQTFGSRNAETVEPRRPPGASAEIIQFSAWKKHCPAADPATS